MEPKSNMDLYKSIKEAQEKLQHIISPTPLIENSNFSNKFRATILLKREDLQVVRSHEIRGAYNKISSLSTEQKKQGVICSSIGNQALAVAFACHQLKITAKIYMSKTTPENKVKQIQFFGKNYIQIILAGDTIGDTFAIAVGDASLNHKVFIHPFDDLKVIAGQGTIGLEILDKFHKPIDYLFVPIHGGALASGISTVFKQLSPHTKVIGVQALGDPSIKTYTANNKRTRLHPIDKFVNGAAVKKASDLTFTICKKNLDDIILVPEGKLCTTILNVYSKEAILLEPAGALSIAALDYYAEIIKGKTVVCIVSGGNSDVEKIVEIKECSLLYEGLLHYFMIQFPRRLGILKEFVNDILGPDDNIVYFHFAKKDSLAESKAVIVLELKNPNNIYSIKKKLNGKGFEYKNINEKHDLFTQLIE
jgi:threonine dehydratase